MITDSQADYLVVLVADRISELERRAKLALTPQEVLEVDAELALAKSVFDALRQ